MKGRECFPPWNRLESYACDSGELLESFPHLIFVFELCYRVAVLGLHVTRLKLELDSVRLSTALRHCRTKTEAQ